MKDQLITALEWERQKDYKSLFEGAIKESARLYKQMWIAETKLEYINNEINKHFDSEQKTIPEGAVINNIENILKADYQMMGIVRK